MQEIQTEGAVEAVAETPAYVTRAELQQVVTFLNELKRSVGDSFARTQEIFTQFDARVKHLEGASPHDRIVSAAINARVEAEALTKAVDIAKGIVSDALAKLNTQDKAVEANGKG